jgi:hypothetical protein
MSIHVLRLPVRERPAGLMGRIWRRLSAGPLRATARPARLRLDALSDATRRDLGLPPRSTGPHR